MVAMARLAALLVFVCGAFLGGGTAVGSSGSGTGLHGLVTKGPTRPVCAIELPCSKPAANLPLVFTRGDVRKTVRTNPSGGYRISLRPGAYSVRVDGSSGLRPRPDPALVRVPRGRYTRVDFSVDTGIR